MRIRTEQARDSDRGCAEAEHAAPIPVATASADAARDMLAALRTVRRRGSGNSVDAAVEALSARLNDPFGALLSPARVAGEARELDDKDAPDRESEDPAPARPAEVGAVVPARPPDTQLLAEDLDAAVMRRAAERAMAEAAAAESDDKPKLPEATAGERSTDPGRGGPDPTHTGRHARHPDHARALHDARLEAHKRQKDIDKHAKALAAGPKPAQDKKPTKPGDRSAPSAPQVPKLKVPPKQPRGDQKPGAAAAGGKADPVEAWHGRVVAKANQIAAPPISDEERYVFDYQAATTKAAKQTPADKVKLIKSAQEAVPPVDKFQGQDDDLELPSPDPMPELRQAVFDKTRRTLKPQALPDLDRSPLNSLPEIGTSVYPEEGSGTKHVLRELGPGEGYAEIVIVKHGDKPPPVMKGLKTEVREDKKLEPGKGTLTERVKAHNAKEPRNITGKGGTGKAKGATISNDMPKGAPKLPRLDDIPKVDTSKVIAAVMAQTDPASRKIVDGALDAFPGNKPIQEVAGFTDVFVPPIKSDILKEMQRIAGKVESGAEAMKGKIDAEKEKADAAVAANQEALDEASKGAKTERWKYSQQIADHIGGLLDDMERTIDDQTAISKGGFDPKEVKAEEKRLRDANEDMVSTWLGNYSTLKKNRSDALVKEQVKQTNAYQATAELDKRTLDDKAGDKPDKATADNVTATKASIDQWLSKHLTDVPEKVAELKSEAAADIATYKRELKQAADAYDTQIQKWANDRIHREKSWWKRLIDVIKDWLGVVTTQKKTWEERSNTDNATTLANDEAELDLMIVNDTGDQTAEKIQARADLTAAQKAMATSYFLPGEHKHDSAAALAAALIVQLGDQWRPHITKQIETKVLGSDDQLVIAVANATPGFDVDSHVTDIISGFKGAGTDKNKVYGALKTKTGTMTRIQARAVELRYRQRTKSSLRSDIDSELYDVGDMIASIIPGSSGRADENRAFALLDAEEDAPAKEIAAQLDAAMHKNAWGTGLGTDKETIYKLLRGKTAEERGAIKAAYREMTGKDLDADVESELDDGVSPVYDINQYYALMRGDKEGADAIAMRRAHGWVSDNWFDKQINKVMFQDVKVADQVYQDIRADVDADAAAASAAGHPWDNAEYDRQLMRRLNSLDKRFGDQFGYDFKVKPGQSALEAAHQTMGGDKAKMLIGERYNNLALESAARISIEHKALILPDKAEVNKALEAQYNRAFAEERRTLENEDQLAQKQAWDNCTVKPKSNSPEDQRKADAETKEKQRKWRKEWLDPEAKARHKRELDRKAERRAAETTKVKMAALKTTYETEFGTGSMFSSGSFEGDVYSATNVTWPGERNADNDKTLALLKGQGYLTRDQQLLFGVKGAGTDDSAVHKAYAGCSKEEIKQIHDNLQKRLAKLGIEDDAADWVLDDFSGSELDDVKIEQLGEPITNEEKREVEKERVRLQKESAGKTSTGDYVLAALTGAPPGVFSSIRNYLSADDNAYMDERLRKLDQSIKALEDEKERLKKAGIQEGDQEWYDKLAPFRDRIDVNTEGVKIGVDANRATLNAAVSWATVGIQVVVGVATLIAGIVLTPVTGGLSTAIAIAVIGALATAGATIAAKAALKGGAYGLEEFAQDAAMAVVDAVAAGLTAGYGGKILGALSWAAKEGESVMMEAVKRVVNAAIQKTIGHFVSGALQAAPGALIGAIAEGGDLMAALDGILQAGAMSVVISNATEGITAHFQNAKVLAARTNPEQFKAALAHYASEHPNVPAHELPGRLRAELDQALFAHNKDVFKEPAMQERLRAELLEGIPPNRRADYGNAKIEMKTPAEINALSGNPKAESAVVMKNGTPVVAVKAGAVLENVGASLPAVPRTPPAAAAPVAHAAAPAPHPAPPVPHAPPAAPPVEHAAAAKPAAPPVEHAAAPKPAAPPVEHAANEPHPTTSKKGNVGGGEGESGAHAPAAGKQIELPRAATAHAEESFAGLNEGPISTHADAPARSTWEAPKPGTELSPEAQAHKALVDERASRLRAEDPSLSPREAERRARNELLHEIRDAAPGPIAAASSQLHDAIHTGNGEAALRALDTIKDLSQRRALIAEVRRLNGNAPMSEILEKLPADVRTRVKDQLDALRANPEHVAAAQKLIDAQESMRQDFERLIENGAEHVAIDAAREKLIEARQAAVDAVSDAYGIDDSQVRQREPTARMGYGLERGAITPAATGGASVAVATPHGTVELTSGAAHLFVDPATGQPRSAGFIAAALGHEIEVHIEQLRSGHYTKITGPELDVGTAINEAEAYRYMQHQAERFGLTPGEREWVNTQLEKHLQILDPVIRARVAAGDFSVPGHAVEHSPLEPWRAHGGELAPTGGAGKPIARFEPTPTGAIGPESHFEALAQKSLNEAGELHPDAKKGMLRELRDLGVPRDQLRAMTDQELATRFFEAQVTEAPKRIAAYRETLPPESRAELDAIRAVPELHAQPVDAELAGRLGKALDMPVVASETLLAGTVRVAADGKTLLIGPGATVGDVLGHIGTVGAVKRYQGALGMVRRVADAVGRVFGRGGPPFGTRAHEAFLEIQKLPGLIESRRLQLLEPELDATTRLRLNEEITRIESQIVRHVSELGDLSPGRGYVEMAGKPIARKAITDPELAKSKLPPVPIRDFPPEVQAVIREQVIDGKVKPGVTESWVHDAKIWTRADVAGLPDGEYIYILRNKDTGEVLKVGKTSYGAGGGALDARMGLYRRAAEMTGYDVQVELHAITAADAEAFEGALRKKLYGDAPGTGAAKGFEWDNMAEHRRTDPTIWGPGTPGEIPKQTEKVLIVSAGEIVGEGDAARRQVTIQHEDGSQQTITTRKVEAEVGKHFEIPEGELYAWKKLKSGKYGLVKATSTDGLPYVRPLEGAARVRAMPDADQHAYLTELMTTHAGKNKTDTVDNVATQLGISRKTMYRLLAGAKPPIDHGEFTIAKLAAKAKPK